MKTPDLTDFETINQYFSQSDKAFHQFWTISQT